MSERVKKSFQVFGCLIIPWAPLIAVFYPMISMVRESAHRVQCETHLKQLGVAFMQYSQENDGMMPNIADRNGGSTWREAVFPYVRSKDSYHCPDRRDTIDAAGFPQDYAANYSGNYGRTQPDKGKGALASPGSLALSRKDYPTPGKLILLLEAENNDRPEFNIDDQVLFGPQTHKLWAGHFSWLSDFLLADGHVKSLPPANTYLYDPKNHSLFNYWYRNDETKLSPNGVAVLQATAARFH